MKLIEENNLNYSVLDDIEELSIYDYEYNHKEQEEIEIDYLYELLNGREKGNG